MPIHTTRLISSLRRIAVSALLLLPVSDTMLAQPQGRYRLIFSDEFNQPNGSQPDPAKWIRSERNQSTWARWISKSEATAFIRHGRLVCRAIPNTVEPSDTARMLTGAVETQGKFAFKYGKIEVRARTNPHQGNFPAIWLMPQPPCQRHPFGGEIDIFETINEEAKAHQTVHSNWTLNLKKRERPCTSEVKTDVSRWHVYGLVWTPSSLTWTIDGKPVFYYAKSADQNALDNGQWPFDHDFYIILNQSVGRKGAWAGQPDTSHTYETQFDWVRVWQFER